jgi:hypothetical protein
VKKKETAVSKFSNDDGFEVDIQPDVSALRMFRSMSFTAWYALGEFVDNSLTSAMKNQKILEKLNGSDYKVRIQIDFPDGTNDLVIRDNAAGISKSEMQRALRMGKAPKDISVGLSRHGVGMKVAAFWWGERLEINTYPIDEPHGWRAVLDISENSEMGNAVTVTPIPSRGFPGTEITIRNLWQKVPVKRTKGAIREYLPSIYRSFLGGGTGADGFACQLEYEGVELRYENPLLLNAPYWPNKNGAKTNSSPLIWKKSFDQKLSTGKRVSGWYGILETMSRDKSGFFLHYRGKGIAGVVPVLSSETGTGYESEGAKDAIAKSSYKPRKIFKQVGSYPDQSFVGEFDVSDFGKTISTDSPLWSVDEEGEFVELLHKEMTSDENQNFIKMAENYRRRGVAKENRREFEESRKKDVDRVQAALNNNVEHSGVDESASDEYEAPPMASSGANEDGDALSASKYTLMDREGHKHSFEVSFIDDRSADFISIFEDTKDGLTHTVRVNSAHPAFDDIHQSVQTHSLLERIAFSMSSAEIFLTVPHKKQLRDKMNEHLRFIGQKPFDE